MVIRADIGITAVYPAETLRDSSELFETEPFIKVARMDILRNDRIELQNAETVLLTHFKRVGNERFTYMLSPARSVNGVACVADMSAAPYIVRVKYVQAANLAVIVLGNSAAGLRSEELPSAFKRQRFFLRKSNAVLYNIIPNPYHIGNIVFGVFSDLHFFTAPIILFVYS